jgi:hypothetical protein
LIQGNANALRARESLVICGHGGIVDLVTCTPSGLAKALQMYILAYSEDNPVFVAIGYSARALGYKSFLLA